MLVRMATRTGVVRNVIVPDVDDGEAYIMYALHDFIQEDVYEVPSIEMDGLFSSALSIDRRASEKEIDRIWLKAFDAAFNFGTRYCNPLQDC